MCKDYSVSKAQTRMRINAGLAAAARRTNYYPRDVLLDKMQVILSDFPNPSIASAVDVWREMMQAYPEDDIAYLRVQKLLKELYPPGGLKYRKNKGKPAFKCAPVTHRANAWAFIIRN